jgi:hypothetical protein
MINKDMIMREAMDIAATKQTDEIDFSKAIKRVQNCGKKWFLKAGKEQGWHYSRKKKPMEIQRAMKAQPEITTDYFRLLLHTHALCHIHRVIASGESINGWTINDGMVCRIDLNGVLGDHEPREDDPLLSVSVEKKVNIDSDNSINFQSDHCNTFK